VTKNFGAENASVPLDNPRTNGFFNETVAGNIWRIEVNHRELPYGAFGETIPLKGLLKKQFAFDKVCKILI